MEGLAHRRSTDSDTEPSVDAVKQVASAIRDAEKKMGVLKKEEEILMQGVVERTKELQALIAHSETLVDAAEDVRCVKNLLFIDKWNFSVFHMRWNAK